MIDLQNRIVYLNIIIMLALNVSVGYFAFKEPPDYIISTTPNLISTDQGGFANFTVTLSPIRAFNSQVTLRIAEIPKGVQATIDNNNTKWNVKEETEVPVNIKIDPTAPAGLFIILIEANSGGLVHTIEEKLNIIGKGKVIVLIENFWFYPDNLTIRKGTEVTWINKDPTGHTATSDQGVFDSKLLRENQQFTYLFDKEDTYGYYCIPHPQMVGTVKIVE